MATMPCPKCGTPNRAGARFCARCGTTLGGATQPQPPPSPAFTPVSSTAPARPPGGATRLYKTTSYVIIAIAGIAAVCVLLAGVGAFAAQMGWFGSIASAPTATATAVAVRTASAVPTLAGATPPSATPIPTGVPPTKVPSTATAWVGTAVLTAVPTLAPTMSPTAPKPTVLPTAGTKPLGDPWESEGVQLNLINLDIRTGEYGEDAALRAWFSFINKTGQRILVDIDYARLYIEDSRGNRYVDYYGSKTDSVWVDAGQRFDFNRYYSRVAGQRSRVPADAKYITVVAEKFSRLANVRWRFDINPQLAPVSAPAPATVKKTGESWEQGGIQLTVTNVDIRVGQYGEDAAFRVFYKATNRTNQKVLLEIDYADLYLTDSFGVRFIDYYGGGYETAWLDPGKDLEFSRYYSTRASARSRISPGAEYVLVIVRKFSRLQNVQWQVNIVR